jgi:hypothetical protein
MVDSATSGSVALTRRAATQFKPGGKAGPGRPKGSRDRADLSQLIMDAAVETGFVKAPSTGYGLAAQRLPR